MKVGICIVLKSNKHILILTPGFPTDEDDSQCIPALQLYVKHLSKRQEIKITVVALYYPYKKGEYLWRGVTVHSLGLPQSKIFKPLNWFKTSRLLNSIQNYDSIDVVHSCWLSDVALMGYLLAKKIGKKHVCTLMGQDVLSQNVYAKILPLSKMSLVTLAKSQQQMLTQNFNVDSIIIPHGIESRPQLLNREVNYDIIGVGSLIPLKNYGLFIDVIAEIKKFDTNVRALILGKGPEYEMLLSKIEHLELENNITLKGIVTREEVFNYMEQSDIFMHTSNYEGFGLVFSEALVCGLKLMSTPVGVAEPSNSWVIGTTIDEFVAAYRKLRNSPLVGLNKIHYVDDMVTKYLSLYNNTDIE